MIITVTLNAAVDKTLSVPSYRPGGRNRAVEQTTAAGGKGINVARALKRLGQPVIATGFAGGATGTRIIEYLTQEAILNDFVRIAGESRTSTVVIDPTTNQHTEINEYGPRVAEAELELFREKLLYLARGADICVVAGSLPRGISEGFYAELMRDLKKTGVTTVLDADGEPMRLGLRAEPDVISPNMIEAEELVGHEFHDDDDVAAGLAQLRELGAKTAIMTHPAGCWASLHDTTPGTYVRVRVEQHEAVSVVGSGDAFLAGYVTARYIGLNSEQSLRYGVACGAESVNHFGAGILDPVAVDRLLEQVELETIEQPVVG